MTENKIENIRLSVSKVSTFADCKAKYNYNYNIKLPKKIWEHHTLGKFIHKVLEDFHLLYLGGSTLPYNEAMTLCFNASKAEYKDTMTKDMMKQAKDMASEYLQLIYKNQFPEVHSCEKPFSFMVADNINVNGAIDRIQKDPDGLFHVCDYKTAKQAKYLEDKFFQLETYAYVVYLENPEVKQVRASYIMLRHGFRYITRVIDIDTILKIPGKFKAYADAIFAETQYQPNPTPLCDYCDFYEACPKAFRKSDNQPKLVSISGKLKSW